MKLNFFNILSVCLFCLGCSSQQQEGLMTNASTDNCIGSCVDGLKADDSQIRISLQGPSGGGSIQISALDLSFDISGTCYVSTYKKSRIALSGEGVEISYYGFDAAGTKVGRDGLTCINGRFNAVVTLLGFKAGSNQGKINAVIYGFDDNNAAHPGNGVQSTNTSSIGIRQNN